MLDYHKDIYVWFVTKLTIKKLILFLVDYIQIFLFNVGVIEECIS